MALAAAAASRTLWADSKILHWVHWSDVHWGSLEDDSQAWHQALQAGLAKRPELVVFSGDHGDNGVGRGDFQDRTRGFWSTWKSQVPLILTLGNSDFRRNYQTDPENLAETHQLYRHCLADYYLDELGNGTRQVAGLKWVSLNSQIFSPRNQYQGAPQQARQSLEWLRSQLGPQTVLLLHIPPCIDLFSGQPAWRPQYSLELFDLLKVQPPLAIISGHFHRNEVHECNQVPLCVAGSLSRKYNYHPNWREWMWRWQEGSLVEASYTLHYCGQRDWQSGYSALPLSDFLDRVSKQGYMQDVFARQANAEDRWSEVRQQFSVTR